MNRHEFKQSIVGGIILTVIILGLLLFFYQMGNRSPLLYILLILPVLFIIGVVKTKLVIEEDVLRYEKVIGTEEISLKNVAQIITREIEIIETSNTANIKPNQKQESNQMMIVGNQERSVQKFVYVMDDSGKTFFSFPANLITRKNRQKFEDAVTAANPNIQVF